MLAAISCGSQWWKKCSRSRSRQGQLEIPAFFGERHSAGPNAGASSEANIAIGHHLAGATRMLVWHQPPQPGALDHEIGEFDRA
jgi:hypothetical protein